MDFGSLDTSNFKDLAEEYGFEAAVFGTVANRLFNVYGNDESDFIVHWYEVFGYYDHVAETGRTEGYHAWQNGLHAETLEDFVGNYDRSDYDTSNPWFWLQLWACGHKYGWH